MAQEYILHLLERQRVGFLADLELRDGLTAQLDAVREEIRTMEQEIRNQGTAGIVQREHDTELAGSQGLPRMPSLRNTTGGPLEGSPTAGGGAGPPAPVDDDHGNHCPSATGVNGPSFARPIDDHGNDLPSATGVNGPPFARPIHLRNPSGTRLGLPATTGHQGPEQHHVRAHYENNLPSTATGFNQPTATQRTTQPGTSVFYEPSTRPGNASTGTPRGHGVPSWSFESLCSPWGKCNFRLLQDGRSAFRAIKLELALAMQLQSTAKSMDFTKDGKCLAVPSGSEIDVIDVLQPTKCRVLQNKRGGKQAVNQVQFCWNDKLLIAGGEGHFDIWNTETGKVRNHYKCPDVVSVAVSRDNRLFAVGDTHKIIALFQIESCSLVRTLGEHPADNANITSLTFSPDGVHLASTSADPVIRVYDVQVHSLRLLEGHGAQVNCAKYSSDGNAIVSGSSDRQVRLWDVRGSRHQLLGEAGDVVTSVDYSSSSRYVLSGCKDSSCTVWDIRMMDAVMQFNSGVTGITCVQVNPCRNMLSATSDDNYVRVWSIGDGSSSK